MKTEEEALQERKDILAKIKKAKDDMSELESQLIDVDSDLTDALGFKAKVIQELAFKLVSDESTRKFLHILEEHGVTPRGSKYKFAGDIDKYNTIVVFDDFTFGFIDTKEVDKTKTIVSVPVWLEWFNPLNRIPLFGESYSTLHLSNNGKFAALSESIMSHALDGMSAQRHYMARTLGLYLKTYQEAKAYAPLFNNRLKTFSDIVNDISDSRQS
jgi:hypothetical protein